MRVCSARWLRSSLPTPTDVRRNRLGGGNSSRLGGLSRAVRSSPVGFAPFNVPSTFLIVEHEAYPPADGVHEAYAVPSRRPMLEAARDLLSPSVQPARG